jgi:hypothetical protein
VQQDPEQTKELVSRNVGSKPHKGLHNNSFKEALLQKKGVDGATSAMEEGKDMEVTLEIEVEEDKVKMLKDAFVGFLLEDIEAKLLQQYFIMDGYHNLKVTTLGHMKVLISSTKEEEVKESERDCEYSWVVVQMV